MGANSSIYIFYYTDIDDFFSLFLKVSDSRVLYCQCFARSLIKSNSCHANTAATQTPQLYFEIVGVAKIVFLFKA